MGATVRFLRVDWPTGHVNIRQQPQEVRPEETGTNLEALGRCDADACLSRGEWWQALPVSVVLLAANALNQLLKAQLELASKNPTGLKFNRHSFEKPETPNLGGKPGSMTAKEVNALKIGKLGLLIADPSQNVGPDIMLSST
jgi:hypothetical protein